MLHKPFAKDDLARARYQAAADLPEEGIFVEGNAMTSRCIERIERIYGANAPGRLRSSIDGGGEARRR